MNYAEEPIYKLIERVDGEWTDMITAGVPWMGDQQIARNRKKRVFYTKRPGLTYRDKLIKQGREVRLIEYRCVGTIN